MSDKTAATGRTMADVRQAAIDALSTNEWREPGRPLAGQSSHTAGHYDYACALCRPDLDDGYGRIVDVVTDALAQAGYGDVRALLHDLAELAADWDAPPRPESPLDVPECSDDLRALTARHTPPAKEDRT